jgi:hypothetical protein
MIKLGLMIHKKRTNPRISTCRCDNRSILVLEDIDAAFAQRDGQNANTLSFSGLLNCIDGVCAQVRFSPSLLLLLFAFFLFCPFFYLRAFFLCFSWRSRVSSSISLHLLFAIAQRNHKRRKRILVFGPRLNCVRGERACGSRHINFFPSFYLSLRFPLCFYFPFCFPCSALSIPGYSWLWRRQWTQYAVRIF